MSAQAEIKVEPISDESIEALYAIAYELYRNGKYVDAEKCFLLMTLCKPAERKYWMGLGASYEMMHNYPKAIEAYGIAAILDPLDPMVHWHAANCFYSQGDETKALAVLKTAIEVANESEEHANLVPSLKNFEQLWSQKLAQ